MKVAEIMTQGAECVSPDVTLQHAAERMRTLEIGCLPVCVDERLIGVVTERDIVLRSVANGNDPRWDVVAQAMTDEEVYCFEDETVETAADIMGHHQIRRLPVLNRDFRIVGMFSLGDLAVRCPDSELVASTLEAVSEPSKPLR